MKGSAPLWTFAFACCIQEGICRRTQSKIPLDAGGTAAFVSDDSQPGTPTKINANSGTQDVALQINATSTASLTPQIASHVTRPRHRQSNATALLEGRHSNVNKHGQISKNKHNPTQLDSTAPLHRGRDVGKSAQDNTNTEQSNAVIEQNSSDGGKDKGYPNNQDSRSAALRKGRQVDFDTNSKHKFAKQRFGSAMLKDRQRHVSKVGKPGKQSTLSTAMAEDDPRLWMVGGLCLLSCGGFCLFQMFFNRKSLIMSKTKENVFRILGSSSLSLMADDPSSSGLSLHSALAQPFANQCLLDTAQVWTSQGAVHVKDLKVGSELVDTEGGVVKIKNSVLKPDWERDFVEVELEEGEFEVTSSHVLEASTNSNAWYPWLAGDLRSELFVKTDIGPRQIIEIHKKPRRPVNVMQIELERNATFWLNASGVWVSIFGAQVEAFAEQVHNLVYLKPPQGLYSIPASISEPNMTHTCAGACYHWKTLGKCKYGQDCVDCHEFGCTKVKMKMGKRQRRRVKRAFSDDPHNHRDSCEK